MASSKYSGCQTPFKDISSTNNNGSWPTTSNLQPDVIDPKESKRQRARDTYANMPQDRKEKLLKKTLRRLSSKESPSSLYKWATTNNPSHCYRWHSLLPFNCILQHLLMWILCTGILSNVDQCYNLEEETMVLDDNADWLHKNDTYSVARTRNTSLQLQSTVINCSVHIILYSVSKANMIYLLYTMNLISMTHLFQFCLIDWH
jgi:hypothetical protein